MKSSRRGSLYSFTLFQFGLKYLAHDLCLLLQRTEFHTKYAQDVKNLPPAILCYCSQIGLFEL